MSFSVKSFYIWCNMNYSNKTVLYIYIYIYIQHIYSSPFQFMLCLVLSVLSSFQFIVCLEELLPQFIDLTFRLLRGALLLCSLHLGLQPLQLSTTPLCLSQKLNLRILGAVRWNDLSVWYAVYRYYLLTAEYIYMISRTVVWPIWPQFGGYVIIISWITQLDYCIISIWSVFCVWTWQYPVLVEPMRWILANRY